MKNTTYNICLSSKRRVVVSMPLILASLLIAAPFVLSGSVEHPTSTESSQAAFVSQATDDPLQRLLPTIEARRYYDPYELCRDGQLDPYATWRGVKDPQAGATFLRDQFARHGSLDNLVQWMSCQGFRITFARGPFRNDNESVLFAQFAFAAYERSGKGLWRRFLP